MINQAARELWSDYLRESDADAAEMLRIAYLRALCEPEVPANDDKALDKLAEQLPIGAARCFDFEDHDEQALEAHERRITRCRAQECRARIVWLETSSGKKMPCDADTVEPEDTEFDASRHESHFSTCPASGRFRKAR